MREGVRLTTKLYVMCDMCDYVCYVMLCVMLLRSWVRKG